MFTRFRTNRTRMILASLALAIYTAAATTGIAAAANPNRTFEVTACATPNDKNLILMVSWSGVTVSAWSFFIESTEGSGGLFQPVPEVADTGTLTETFRGDDVSVIQSVSATLFRAAGPNFIEVESATIVQPASGWPRC